MKIWLASASPRRHRLLLWAGYEVEVHPTVTDEQRHPSADPITHAIDLARKKATAAPNSRLTPGPPDLLVVAADTVVHVKDRIFDKPANEEMARQHLEALSGKWHRVTTGVCVRRWGEQHSFGVTTKVRFRRLSPQEIASYVASGEPMDKAGAYGIQGRGGALVAEINGSWTNVMGLPLEETIAAIEGTG
ncbi:MAG: septum formation protein Maf [Proteobacteria bacterium]|jgi:septum formation protein|nr:septum formation protein Maf [Pseudomonadota bacterium]